MNKFNARKVKVDGMIFDSRREAARWRDLNLLQRAGKISDLRRQVRFLLTPSFFGEDGKAILRASSYVADFVYTENGKTVVEDCKGLKTDVYILKKKLMYEKYGILIRET